ncbi:class I SAM-dependent methyltransferase (plasmid) [Shinella sumterensis]|nr:class I SAM-dependent methyltransferase [Shinella sumterensis]
MSIRCSVCGGEEFGVTPVLWPKLIGEWQLSPSEADYIDRQQGECCTNCGANLRSIALSDALLSCYQEHGTLIQAVQSGSLASKKVLEINEAGTLHKVLEDLPNLTFGQYPDVDMHALPYPDESFDLVMHSDTLEHVENPIHALRECARVLKEDGFLCFTVPIIVERLSRSRAGLPKSYHGNPAQSGDDYLVHTEFGADAWVLPLRAGFRKVALNAIDFPAALALVAAK